MFSRVSSAISRQCIRPRMVSHTRGLQTRALILGSPGCGKGTMSERLVRDFEFEHVSSGDALRNQIASGSDLGALAQTFIKGGNLVPDDLITDLVLGHVSTLPANKPWLLDGFPRTAAQAKSLDAMFDINLVINVDVPESEVLDRLSNRRVHVASGRSYHLIWNPPKTPDVDDVTGEPLLHRPDDTVEAIRERLVIYHRETQPLIEHYKNKGVLHTFSGTESDVIYPVMQAQVRKHFDESK